MMSNVDEKYLFAVSDDEDDAAPGAVSSLSSEDEARSPVDWRAVVHRTAREQLGGGGAPDAARLRRAVPAALPAPAPVQSPRGGIAM